MAKLPLKVRVDIRDLWDAPTSAVAKSADSLYKILGHKINPEVEWPALWADLGDRFPEKEGFVPAVIAASTAWYERLSARLENSVYQNWTDDLLGLLSEPSQRRELKLHIQSAAPGSTPRPTTLWDSKLSSFIIKIPNAQPSSLAAMTSGFDKDFENIFNEKPATSTKDDEWAHVDDNELETVSSYSAFPAKSTDRLPTLDMLLRPDELFRTTTPYILMVDVKNTQSIVVQCSHQASLELMAGYLQKWGKKSNYNTRWPTVLKVELHDSDFCFGVMDSLTIQSADSHSSVNPAIVLAFIEGILGYQLVHTTGYHWVYRYEKMLK